MRNLRVNRIDNESLQAGLTDIFMEIVGESGYCRAPIRTHSITVAFLLPCPANGRFCCNRSLGLRYILFGPSHGGGSRSRVCAQLCRFQTLQSRLSDRARRFRLSCPEIVVDGGRGAALCLMSTCILSVQARCRGDDGDVHSWGKGGESLL